ncbi:MAG: Clp protease ClpP [Prevotella sp.]|jgi:ATP-dependent protease ClpP protease subunit|nr:Clp protease ClpP [Prevotella sp.]MCH3994134.1 Clp protease ClpP [Prevotella sp.]
MKYDYYITGTIGEEYDWFTGTKGTTSVMVKDFLEKNKNKEVNILVSSPGGFLDEGIAIGEYIAAHGKCNMYIVGMTASAATVLCMKAKSVNIAQGSMILIHNASYTIDEWGSANKQGFDALIEKFKKEREDLDTFDKGIAQIYSQKNGRSIEENLSKMNESKWMLSDEAIKFGLVDSIFDDDNSKTAARNICQKVANKGGIAEHYGLPDIPTNDHDGFWKKLRTTLSGAVGMINDVMPEEQNNIINEAKKMKKKVFNNVCAALSVQDIEVDDDGKATITEDQLNKIENSMKATTDKITALTTDKQKADDKLATLQKEYDDYKAEAGDESPAHPQVSKNNEPQSAKDLYNDIKDLM